MPSAKGVIRIDSDSTHGWQVRVYRDGKTFSRLFSDKKWGGKDKAFEAAQAYREELARGGRPAPVPSRGGDG